MRIAIRIICGPSADKYRVKEKTNEAKRAWRGKQDGAFLSLLPACNMEIT
jgi:hypothetical protein